MEAAAYQCVLTWISSPSGPLDVQEVQGTASQRHGEGGQDVAQPHDPHKHEVYQDDLMITELLTELQAIGEGED